MSTSETVQLATSAPLWDRFFLVAPLVLIATKEGDGYDVAPKHMASPLGWQNYYGFVCTPKHATYRNIEEHGAFTVSFPRAEQIVSTSMAASAREDDGNKPGLAALQTHRASRVDCVLVDGCSLYLECELERIIDGFGDSSLIAGRVVAAAASEDVLRSPERDDNDLLRAEAPLVYLNPGRFGTVDTTQAFPFSIDFSL
jgi:flavin reductase (DIM6/NTAB) family NADH-FMN oxidoreductase RutF